MIKLSSKFQEDGKCQPFSIEIQILDPRNIKALREYYILFKD